MTSTPDERHPIEVLAEDFVRRQRDGEAPTIEEYAAAHAELADDIRELLPAVLAMEGLKLSRESTGSGRSGRLDFDESLERLGDYRIVREIGRGGMGIVFEAEQESLGRPVAVKVLPRRSMKDARRVQRFESEARTAARLHHTNIVPVFGVGEQDGLHYYVMQLIDGVGLDEVLSEFRQDDSRIGEQQAGPAQRAAEALSREGSRARVTARLGVDVAEALAYAHEAGTLHRDIKPGNLLIDSRGDVWITDFGIARALESADLTRTGDIVGTLQYMAPEHSDGEFDIRGDVYGLGVTLYETLTLQRAFESRAPAALLKLVRDGNVTPPSAIDPTVPRDLETIILKAMAPEPRARYESARAMARDLERFLQDRPILARRPTVAETLWRWCRRNRAVASLATVAAASLIVAAVTGWTGFVARGESLRRESEEKARAVTEAKRAERNLEVSLQAFDDIFDRVAGPDRFIEVTEESSDETVLVETNVSQKDADLLQRVLAFYDAFAETNATNARLQVEAARAQRRVAEIHDRLRNSEEAEEAFLRAIEILESIDPTPETADRLAADLALAHTGLADLLSRHRRRAEGAVHHEAARRIAELGSVPINHVQSRHTLIETLRHMANLRLMRRGPRRRDEPEGEDARSLYVRAVTVAEETAKHHPERLQAALDVAIVHRSLAWMDWYGRRGDRIEVERAAIARFERLLERWPDRTDVKLELVKALKGPRGRFYQVKDDEADAVIARLERARELTAEALSRTPGLTVAESEQAEILASLGATHWTCRKDPEAAESLLREALALWSELAGQSDDHRIEMKAVRMRFFLVDILRDLDRTSEAVAEVEAIISVLEKHDDRFLRHILARAWGTLAQIHDSAGDEEAATEARRHAEDATPKRRHRRSRTTPDRP